MVCFDCSQSSDSNTKTDSNNCHDDDPTPDCSKELNGYAKITLIKIN